MGGEGKGKPPPKQGQGGFAGQLRMDSAHPLPGDSRVGTRGTLAGKGAGGPRQGPVRLSPRSTRVPAALSRCPLQAGGAEGTEIAGDTRSPTGQRSPVPAEVPPRGPRATTVTSGDPCEHRGLRDPPEPLTRLGAGEEGLGPSLNWGAGLGASTQLCPGRQGWPHAWPRLGAQRGRAAPCSPKFKATKVLRAQSLPGQARLFLLG